MLKIYQRSVPVDFVTLADQLEKDKSLKFAAEGTALVRKVMYSIPPTFSNVLSFSSWSASVGLNAVLNGFIIICLAGIFYLVFLFICAKIDKKKGKEREKDKNRDPFIH